MALRLSGLVGSVKRALVGIEGRVTRSEIYLTNLGTGEIIQLCMTPEVVKARSETNFRTYNVIERGEIKMPKGEHLTTLSWSGILPGANILLSSFVTLAAWQPPRELVADLTRWRQDGDKLKVLITQTPINLDVFIKNFDYEMSGGQGNIKYTLDLVVAKEIRVMTVEEADARRRAGQELRSRVSLKSKTGVMLGKVNNVWSAAQILLGNGGSWQELAERNGISDGAEPNREMIWG